MNAEMKQLWEQHRTLWALMTEAAIAVQAAANLYELPHPVHDAALQEFDLLATEVDAVRTKILALRPDERYIRPAVAARR